MNWKIKSQIMRICSSSSLGRSFYRFLQRASGNIKANPETRVPLYLQMLEWLQNENIKVKDATILEVGTGHLPVIPICFYLSGAERIISCDLNERLNAKLSIEALNWFYDNRKDLRNKFLPIVDEQTFDARMETLKQNKDDIKAFMNSASILYDAPADAAATELENQSIDIHFSVTVLEHIPNKIIESIFREAKRLLKPNGVAIHFVDLSDHFQHQDHSITRINFLQYSSDKWDFFAGNEYAYCNRLRPPHYIDTLERNGAQFLRAEATVDKHAKPALANGFAVNEQFSTLSSDDICTRKFNFIVSFNDENPETSSSAKPIYIYD